jgi:hypothetical protein
VDWRRFIILVHVIDSMDLMLRWITPAGESLLPFIRAKWRTNKGLQGF